MSSTYHDTPIRRWHLPPRTLEARTGFGRGVETDTVVETCPSTFYTRRGSQRSNKTNSFSPFQQQGAVRLVPASQAYVSERLPGWRATPRTGLVSLVPRWWRTQRPAQHRTESDRLRHGPCVQVRAELPQRVRVGGRRRLVLVQSVQTLGRRGSRIGPNAPLQVHSASQQGGLCGMCGCVSVL